MRSKPSKNKNKNGSEWDIENEIDPSESDRINQIPWVFCILMLIGISIIAFMECMRI